MLTPEKQRQAARTEDGYSNPFWTEWARVVGCIKHRTEQEATIHRFRDDRERLDQLGTYCAACTKEADEESERQRREDRRIERVRECQRYLKLPARFAASTFDNFQTSVKRQREALAVVREYARGFAESFQLGRSLLLSGSVGTGKTHLAAALGRALADDGWYVRYDQAPEVIRAIKDTWRRDSDRTEGEVIAKYARDQLLIIDELGVGFNSDTEARFFGEIIDLRYRENRPTVIVTNLDANALREALGLRAFDRLMERGNRAVIFDWPSFRRSAEMGALRATESTTGSTLQ